MKVRRYSLAHYVLFVVAYVTWGVASVLLATYLTATYENRAWVIKDEWFLGTLVVMIALISAGGAWLDGIMEKMVGGDEK